MEFDRFVAITQGSLLGFKETLSQQNKLDQLAKANDRCRTICLERELSYGEVSRLERKLFLVLLLNSDDINEQNTKWRADPSTRHLTGLFSLNHGLVCDVIHHHGWDAYLIEAFPGLPSEVSKTLAQKWTQFQKRTRNVVPNDLMSGLTISILLSALTCDDQELLSEFDQLVAENLTLNLSSEDESIKSLRLAVILFCLTLFQSGKKISQIIKTPSELSLVQFYPDWVSKTTQSVALPLSFEVLGNAVVDLISHQSVDDWSGYMDQSSQEFVQDKFISYWPSSEHAPSNMQAVIAHIAHKVLCSDRPSYPNSLMDPMLKSIANKFVKEKEFSVSKLGLYDKKRLCQSNETPQWQKDLILANVILEHIDDLAQDSELQVLVRSNASRCTEHTEAFLEQICLLECPSSSPQVVELLHFMIMASDSLLTVQRLLETRVQKLGIVAELKSPSYDLDLKKLLNTMTRTMTIASSNLKRTNKCEAKVDYDQPMLLSLSIQAPKTTLLALISEAIQNPGASEMIMDKMIMDLKSVVLHSEFQSSLTQLFVNLEHEFLAKSEAMIQAFTHLCLQFPSLRILLCRQSVERVLLDENRPHLKLLESVFQPSLVDQDNDDTLAILSMLCYILTRSDNLQWEERILNIVQPFRKSDADKFLEEVLPPSLLNVIDRQIDSRLSLGLKDKTVLERALLMSSLYPREWVKIVTSLEDIAFGLDAFELVVCHMDLKQVHVISSIQGFAQAIGGYINEKDPILDVDSLWTFRAICAFLCHIQSEVSSVFPILATLFFPILNSLLDQMDNKNTMKAAQKMRTLSYLYCVHDFPEKELLMQRMRQSE